MLTPYDTKLPPDLRALKEEIEGHARAYGLDFYETIFEVIDADDLNEIAAYGGFPTRYPHWSFGMAYEELKKGYEYGLSKIYEMVINNDPCYAYLMRCNHVVDQKLVMAHVYGHCLAPETRVETRDGIKRIDEIQIGEEVLTHRGRYRPVTFVAKRRHDGPIYRFTVGGSNQVVRITGEHPVLVVRGHACTLAGREAVPCKPTCQVQHKCAAPRPYENYAPEWVEARDVKPGDWVLFPRRQRIPEAAAAAVEIVYDKIVHRRRRVGRHIISVDARLAKFLGYFIAEGNAQPRGLIGFGFHRDESTLHEEVAWLAESIFGARVGRDDSRTALATTIRFNNLEIARWLREFVGTSADRKCIPDFLYEQEDVTLLASCLAGIFNGDGTFTRAAGRDSGTLSLTTISERLAYQLRHLCLRLKVKTAIYSRQRVGRRPSYDVVWSGESAHLLSHRLLGVDVIEGDRQFERSWADDDYLYQPVRQVERVPYAGEVYNFSVEEDESYTLAAGFAVHNCDFFKNNAYFAHTNRKMMDEMANHGMRIRRYAEKYGEDEVEAFVDRCMSIDDLIDIHSVAIKRRDEVSRYDFAPPKDEGEEDRATRFKSKGYMDPYINPEKVLKAEEEEKRRLKEQAARNFPERPEKDVLLFLIEYAPLKPWQRDVLSIVRDEAYYFAPQGMTKILNEGWACAERNTLLFTDRGCLRLGDVVDQRLAVRVSDGETARAVYDWAKFEDRETIWVRTRRGFELEGSVTHRLMLPDGSWKRLDELQPGDTVRIGGGRNLWASDYVPLDWAPQRRPTLAAVAATAGVDVETVIRYRRGVRGVHSATLAPLVAEYEAGRATVSYQQNKRRQVTIPQVVDEDLGAFLGYLTGDGHISAVKRTIGLTTGDEAQADRFAALVRKLFGLRAVKTWDDGRWRVGFSSRHVEDFLTHLGLKTGPCAREKDVPEVILRSPRSVVAAFLRGLYDADGYAGPAGVILATNSTAMSKTVQLLLLNFGILSTRRPHQDGCWHVHTTGRSAEVFLQEIGFGLERKQEALRSYVEDRQWFKREDEDDAILAMERRRADVYDISVEETHRYAAQGFINHNSYWHSTIMTQKSLEPWECIDYADHHSGTMATHGPRLNPYKLGIELLRDIEHRWNTGKFGKEWEECDDLDRRRNWNKQLGLGRQKIFEVRRVHNDITFIDTFLTPEFCTEHKMFSFAFQEQMGQYVIDSREFEKIKKRLLFSLTNFGKPWIYVVDGNYRNRGELLLKHEYNGVDLRLDQARDTLANIQVIWSRPVHLQTVVDGKVTTLSFDGSEHSMKTGGETDDARRSSSGKTR